MEYSKDDLIEAKRQISSTLHRSSNARLTVEQDSRSPAEIVRIPGQHLPSLSA